MIVRWAIFAAAILAAGAAPPAGSTRELVYFAPSGPVRIRIHIALAGHPAEDIWNKALDRLFAFRDQNRDGGLDAQERSPFGPIRVSSRLDFFEGPMVSQPLRLAFAKKDEKVTRAAFGEAMRAAGKDAIGFRVVRPPADSSALSAVLFRHLDRNGDGRLSTEELKAARERLAILDVNEDEFVTAAELLDRGVPPAGRGRSLPLPQPDQETREGPSDLVFLPSIGERGVKPLLAARVGAKATALKKAEFGAEAKSFDSLDQDGNGILDSTELAAWLSKPPGIELTLHFDASGNRFIATGAVETGGMWKAAFPGSVFRFEKPAPWPVARWTAEADRVCQNLHALTKDKPLERKALERDLSALAFFDFAVRSADAKLGAADIEAARKALEPLAACRVEVECIDRGDGLFNLLDRDGDGRLSPRELAEAPTIVTPFASADGSFGPENLVRQLALRFVVDPVPVGLLVPPAAGGPSPRGPTPLWFSKMDRNGDGDVSLREFLGPIELFRKLDRNGDGLIEPAEVAGTP